MRAFEFIDKQDSIKLLQGIFNKTLDAIANHPKQVRCLPTPAAKATPPAAKKAAVTKTKSTSKTKAKPKAKSKKKFKLKKPSTKPASNTPATQTLAAPTTNVQNTNLNPASQAKFTSQPQAPTQPIKTSNRPLEKYLDAMNKLQNKQD